MYKLLIVFLLLSITNLGVAQKNNIKKASAYVVEANKLYYQKKYSEAENKYRAALKIDPTNINAKHNLTQALLKQNKVNEALQQMEENTKSILDKNRKANEYYNMGNLYAKQKNYPKALEQYKQAMRNNPQHTRARYNYQYLKKIAENNSSNNSNSGNNNNKQKQQQQNQSEALKNQELNRKLEEIERQEKKAQQQRMQQRKSNSGGGSKNW